MTHEDFLRIKQNAESGDSDAQFDLGKCYESGRGVDVDLEKAFKWYEIAANSGHSKAQYKLGIFYQLGLGLGFPNDYEAFKWFEKAAEQDNRDALFQLAICYEDSRGTSPNLRKAYQCYERAASLGHKRSVERVEYKKGYLDWPYDDNGNYIWKCVKCGALLREQVGFRDGVSSWTCTNCGTVIKLNRAFESSFDDNHYEDIDFAVNRNVDAIAPDIDLVINNIDTDDDFVSVEGSTYIDSEYLGKNRRHNKKNDLSKIYQ